MNGFLSNSGIAKENETHSLLYVWKGVGQQMAGGRTSFGGGHVDEGRVRRDWCEPVLLQTCGARILRHDDERCGRRGRGEHDETHGHVGRYFLIVLVVILPGGDSATGPPSILARHGPRHGIVE